MQRLLLTCVSLKIIELVLKDTFSATMDNVKNAIATVQVAMEAAQMEPIFVKSWPVVRDASKLSKRRRQY